MNDRQELIKQVINLIIAKKESWEVIKNSKSKSISNDEICYRIEEDEDIIKMLNEVIF